MHRQYVITALGYGLLGLLLGIYMAHSQNHLQHVTHAHIMLIGFVVSFVYGVCYKLWLAGLDNLLGKVQMIAHQVGTLGIIIGLFLLYGGYAPEAVLGPLLGVASLAVFAAMLLMKIQFVCHCKKD